MTKLVATLCVYNEEQFIERAIKGLAKITDIDAIEVLDGAWKNGGKTTKSSDRTKEIVMSLDVGIPINFTEPLLDKHWISEPSKRNTQLEMIMKNYGKGTHTFWIDGDEQIRFPNGLVEMKLKPHLIEGICGVIKTFAIGSDNPFPGPRIIPAGMGYHWHTGIAMHVHDLNCKTVMDFNEAENPVINSATTYKLENLFIVNWWTARSDERVYGDKLEYWKWQQYNKMNPPSCIFQNIPVKAVP